MIPNGFTRKDTEKRLEWLQEKIGMDINPDLENKPEELKGIIENHIGYMKVPMAVAGPLLIDGNYAKGEFYLSLIHI